MKLIRIEDEADIERYAIENNISKQEVREMLIELWETRDE